MEEVTHEEMVLIKKAYVEALEQVAICTMRMHIAAFIRAPKELGSVLLKRVMESIQVVTNIKPEILDKAKWNITTKSESKQ